MMQITCPNCQRKYRVDQSKISPEMSKARCRACGQIIPLEFASPVVPQQPPPKPRTASAAEKKNYGRTGSGRKWLALAALVVVISVVLTGFFLGSDYLKTNWFEVIKGKGAHKAPVAVKKQAGARHRVSIQPIIGFKVNVPMMLDNLEARISEDKKDLKYKMTVATLKGLDLQWVRLLLYPDPKQTLSLVMLVNGVDGKSPHALFKPNGLLSQIAEPAEDGCYRFKKEAFPDSENNNFPLDLYRIWLVEHGAVLAPNSLFKTGEEAEKSVLLSKVNRFAGSLETNQDLIVLAADIPKDIDKGWEKKIQSHPALEGIPQARMISAMGLGILSKMAESLKQVESLALTFRFSGDKKRILRYAQQFRQDVEGSRVYQALKSGKLEDMDLDDMVVNLVNVIQDERFDSKVQFSNNRLVLEFNWSEKDDQAIFAALSQATVGHLMAQAMEIKPTEGEVETVYTDEPRLVSSVDVNNLKQQIPRSFKNRLFPGHFWDFGEEPHMTLELDTVGLPNGDLAKATYEVLAVDSSEGNSVLRQEESQFKQIIRPSSVSPGNISVPVEKGTAAEALGKAKIRFRISLPVELQIAEFSSREPVGSAKGVRGVKVKLQQLEKDVAKISFVGGKAARLFAYDKSGRPLVSKESMNSASSSTARFKGLIDRLKVVVATEILDYPFEVDVDLNGGKELALTGKPEIPPRVRYEEKPVIDYANFTEQDLANLEIKWIEGGERSWSDSLSLDLPKGPFKGEVRWEAHFFAKDKPLLLPGTSMWGSKSLSFSLDKDALKKADAAFGLVQLKLATDIKRLAFAKPDKGSSVEKVLPSGQKITVTFNKNQIVCSTGKIPVIQFMAYDAKGRRLKHENYSEGSNREWLAYFWGEPTKLVIDLSTRMIEKTVPFDYQKRPVDQAAYQKIKEDVEVQREIVRALKNIGRTRNRHFFTYGDDLAGSYYLYNRKQKPMKLINQLVAHSDPAGVDRFAYKVTPYKGYYFTVLAGTESNGVKEDYKRLAEKKTYRWDKGTITTAPLVQPPDIVAIPEDKTQPTFFLQWNQVYMKQLNGEKLKYLPRDYYNTGWVEAKFMGT